MSESIGVAVIGCGTVGTGVASVLIDHHAHLMRRAGCAIDLRWVIVLNPDKPRAAIIPRSLISTDLNLALSDPNVAIVVELIGGTAHARHVVLAALGAGKHVVTANKALLAACGMEIFEAARKAKRTVCFEAAVAGGVPIIRALAESLAANQVTAIQGILNGTSNFILTAMTERGMAYPAALAEAQRLGYAEADPTLDVDGSDAAHKLAVLAQIAFGVTARPEQIGRQGIDQLDAIDINFAAELGYTIKLLAEAWTDGNIRDTASGNEIGVALHVAPVLLRRTSLLAQVRGAYNAVMLRGDIVGETLYQGPGAGMMPTASAVVADLIDLAVGRAQRTFEAARLWSNEGNGYRVQPAERVRSRFYLRLSVADRPGVLADVTRILADQGISVSGVVQHESAEERDNSPVPLVMLTHTAETSKFRAALATIDQLPAVTARAISYPMGD